MKLYHGFRHFEKILEADKLLCQSLGFSLPDDDPPSRYITPSLIIAAGAEHILPFYVFNLSQLVKDKAEEISATAEEYFSKKISADEIRNTSSEYRSAVTSIEFYKANVIYLAKKPSFGYNFFVLDVPEKLILDTPPCYPAVAGELSLDYVTSLLIEQEYEYDIKSLVKKSQRTFDIHIYEHEDEDLPF